MKGLFLLAKAADIKRKQATTVNCYHLPVYSSTSLLNNQLVYLPTCLLNNQLVYSSTRPIQPSNFIYPVV